MYFHLCEIYLVFAETKSQRGKLEPSALVEMNETGSRE